MSWPLRDGTKTEMAFDRKKVLHPWSKYSPQWSTKGWNTEDEQI